MLSKNQIEAVRNLKCETREEYMNELSKILGVGITVERANCVSSMRGMSHTHKILKDENHYVDFRTKKNKLVELSIYDVATDKTLHLRNIRNKWKRLVRFNGLEPIYEEI